jgi:acyl-coenzyme A synthetase/AMP-(fatty) acid ligase
VYLSTSGTTSVPKTFGLTYKRLMTNADRYAADPKEGRSLRLGSVEFDAIRLNRLCSLLAGGVCIGLRQQSLDSLVSICERESVSVLRVGPYKLASLLGSSISGRRLPRATAILASGSRVCGALRQQVRDQLSENLWVQYSTSETGLISTAAPDQHGAFPEGIGFPEPGVEVEIVGPENAAVPPGEVGRIRVRKETMASSYIHEPGAGSKFNGGWFVPGDLVSREPDGPLIFHGRADDVMILNGINVFPSAIEDVLESLPSVREAVAFPLKSRIHGEIPAAAVVLSEKAEDADISRMLDHCRQMLGLRAPRQIRVVDSIPRNAFGKPLRKELAAAC